MSKLTAKQMVYEAKIFYEDIASNNAPSFSDREWSVILTNAQHQVVYEIYREGYDNNEENRIGISPLFKPFKQEEFTRGNIPNSYKITYPSNMMYVSYESCVVSKAGKELSGVAIVPMSYDAYHSNISNPFKKPTDIKVWRLLGYDGNNLIISSNALKKYESIYISKPEPIIVSTLKESQAIEMQDGMPIYEQADCKLHSNLHRRISNTAAKIAYASTGEQLGYQIQDAESKKT